MHGERYTGQVHRCFHFHPGGLKIDPLDGDTGTAGKVQAQGPAPGFYECPIHVSALRGIEVERIVLKVPFGLSVQGLHVPDQISVTIPKKTLVPGSIIPVPGDVLHDEGIGVRFLN